jgi:acyl-CoA hydrolase
VSLGSKQILKWMDAVACMSAERFCNHTCVTRAMDDVTFDGELKLGQVAILKSQVNAAFGTSMEVGCKCFVEELGQPPRSFCNGYFTFISPTNDKPPKGIKLGKLLPDSLPALSRPDETRSELDDTPSGLHLPAPWLEASTPGSAGSSSRNMNGVCVCGVCVRVCVCVCVCVRERERERVSV